MNAASIPFARRDARAGVEWLKGRKEINPREIGLIGHSEGGIIAPLVASRSRDIAFIALLAGAGLPGDEVLYLQAQAILKLAGARLQTRARLFRHIFDALRASDQTCFLQEDGSGKLAACQPSQAGA